MEQKMYWKNGFYDVPIDGAVEITEKYWKELLDGQSAGLIIVENEKGYPILKEYEPTLLELKAQKIAELQAYDSSESVNSLSICNVSGWLNTVSYTHLDVYKRQLVHTTISPVEATAKLAPVMAASAFRKR